MSLINEALKKAQRLHHDQQAGAASAGPADASAPHIRRRGQPLRTQTFILIGAAAAVLVVVSVVITVTLLNRAPAEAGVALPPVAAIPPPEPAALSTPSPVIVAPVITPRPATTVSAALGTPPSATEIPDASPISAASIPAAVPAATPPLPAISGGGTPDPRIQDYVDAMRVTGIRSSGSDSKVLMNERVYRVNDFVDRTLGLKLIEVASDNLTFADANGVTYVKNF